MRKMIVTDLTRFATSNPNVCIAVIDEETGECFRPMPYRTYAKCKMLNIRPGTILKGHIEYMTDASSPHLEDAFCEDSTLENLGHCSGKNFQRILENSLSPSISEGFNVIFEEGKRCIPVGTRLDRSIITIKIKPSQLSIYEDLYTKGRVRATIIDSDGHKFTALSITDRGFYDYAMKHQVSGRLDELKAFINTQQSIYVRIGLGREYQNVYWLQVNGIYTYPNFLESIRSYGE